MIVVDTNVISELVRQAPDTGVLAWLDSLELSEVATTAVTAAELRYGVARLPDGHRKRELTVVIRGILAEDFYGRVLPFDERASTRYADIVTSQDKQANPEHRRCVEPVKLGARRAGSLLKLRLSAYAEHR